MAGKGLEIQIGMQFEILPKFRGAFKNQRNFNEQKLIDLKAAQQKSVREGI